MSENVDQSGKSVSNLEYPVAVTPDKRKSFMGSSTIKKSAMNDLHEAIEAFEDREVLLQALEPKIWKNIPICVCDAFELVREEMVKAQKLTSSTFQANRRVVKKIDLDLVLYRQEQNMQEARIYQSINKLEQRVFEKIREETESLEEAVS